MKSLIIYIAAICCCFADGGFVLQPNEHATEPSQRATIIYDNGVQDTFLQVSLEGEVSEFGWLVPVPSKPTLEQIEKIPEFDVTEHFRQTPYRDFSSLVYLSNPLGATSIVPEVKIDKVKLRSYDVSLIPPIGDGVPKWLQQNGFEINEKARKIIADYRRDGWYFCAIKLNASAEKKKHDILLPPIKFSFKTDKPVFPLRISQINESPSFVNIQFISKEVYSPVVNILSKDIQSEKEWLKYLLYREGVPADFIYQPLHYGKTSAINISTIRNREKPNVSQHLYCVNLKKWYNSDEMSQDIYFEAGSKLMFNNLKKQFDISMTKVIKSFDFHRFDKYTLNMIKDCHTPEFQNMANYFTLKNVEELATLNSTYSNIEEHLQAAVEREFSELKETDLSDEFTFYKYDKATNKVITKMVSAKKLIELSVNSFNNNKWDSQLEVLKNEYQVCSFGKTRFNPNDLLPKREPVIKLTDRNKYVKLNDYFDLVTGATHDGLVFKDLNPHIYHKRIISLLEKVVTVWNPELDIIQKTTNNYEKEMQLLSNFVNQEKSQLFTKKYSSSAIIGDTVWKGNMLTGAAWSYSQYSPYFYETNLYLRKIIIQRFTKNKDFFYAFGDENGNSLPINNLFLKHVTKKTKSLIPVLIQWLKSDKKELKHNAIIALSQLSFLSLDNNTESNTIIASYKDDLENHLPLKPFSRNSGDFWSYVLRLNYGLATGSFAQQYFDIFSELKHNSQQDDKSFQFNSAKVYRALSNFCDLYEDEVEMTRVEQEKQLTDLLFKKSYKVNNKKSHIEQVIDLFWSEITMKAYQASSDQSSFSGAKLKLIADLKRYPKGPYFDGKQIDDTVYYASAFIGDPEIKKQIFKTCNLACLFNVRENIHAELLDWLGQKFKDTKDWRYDVLQRLAVKGASLSPKEFCDFQSYFSAVAHNNQLTNKSLMKFIRVSPIPYQTEYIIFPPKLNYPMDVYFELLSMTYAPSNYQNTPRVLKEGEYDEYEEYK